MLPYQINAQHNLPGNWPSSKRHIPGTVLDAIADAILTGGYDARKNPVCPECYVRVANNGKCNCPE